MMRMNKVVYLSVMSMLLLTGCKRDEPIAPGGNAGKGGNATLKVVPKHHGIVIDSCTVYIKYNTQDASATYDDSVKCMPDNGVSTAIFSGLKTGNYYLYGNGWDDNINMGVIGGLPYIIKEENTFSVNLPVTEGD